MMHPLDLVVSKNHLLGHPFYQRWMDGTLTQGELRSYVSNYFPHVLAFPQYVSAVHSRCESPTLRKAFLENLIEEERGDENHPELWLRFGESLGLDRASAAQSTIPESTELVDTFKQLTQSHFASGLGALYAYESQVPAIAEQKIQGLKAHYGVQDDRGLQFFQVHLRADVEHSQTSKSAFDGLSHADQSTALEAAEKASKALWDFLSGLDRASGASCQAA